MTQDDDREMTLHNSHRFTDKGPIEFLRWAWQNYHSGSNEQETRAIAKRDNTKQCPACGGVGWHKSSSGQGKHELHEYKCDNVCRVSMYYVEP